MNAVLLIRVYVTSQINVFINFLHKIPFLGSFVPESLYGKYNLKKLLSVLGVSFDVVKKVVARGALVLLLVRYLAYVIMSQNDYTIFRTMFLFVLLFVIYPFFGGSSLFKADTEDQMFIHYFMLNPRSYYIYKAIKALILGGISVIPVLIYMYQDLLVIGTLTLLYVAGMVFTDMIYLAYFKRKHALPKRSLRRILGLLVIATGYFACGLRIIPNIILSASIYVILCCTAVIVSICGIIYVFRYNQYKEIAVKYADKALIRFAISSGGSYDAEIAKVTDKGSEYHKEYFEKNRSMPSVAYIDKVFRIRYRRAIWEPILTNAVVYSIILAIIGITVRLGWVNITAESLATYSTILVSIIISTSTVPSSSQRYFRNVDYIYMRSRMITKDYLKKLMLHRYFRTIVIDVVISLMLAIEVLSFLFTSGIKMPINEYMWLVLSVVPILIVYDTYEWFMYYWIQPYSSDLTVKSPVFNVIGYVTSLLMLLLLFIRINIYKFLVPIIGITIFTMVAFCIYSNYAYKTFKIRY